MPNCIFLILLIVIVAGVLVWALNALPLDATIKAVGRVAVIVIFVIWLAYTVMGCLGVAAPWHLQR